MMRQSLRDRAGFDQRDGVRMRNPKRKVDRRRPAVHLGNSAVRNGTVFEQSTMSRRVEKIAVENDGSTQRPTSMQNYSAR
jgi:hypothetical protein